MTERIAITSRIATRWFLPLVLVIGGSVQPGNAATDSSSFSTVINAPPEIIGNSASIGSNTQLNVSEGGEVGIFFQAGLASDQGVSTNVEVNISGGNIGRNFSANRNSTVNISGGRIGSSFEAKNGSLVNVMGNPTFEAFFTAGSGSDVRIHGGSFSNIESAGGATLSITGGEFVNILARTNTALNIDGGLLRGAFTDGGNNVVNIAGGRFAPRFDAGRADSMVTLIGNEFLLDGAPIRGLTVTLATGQSLTGTLRDGSTFVFTANGSSERLRNARLQYVALPDLELTPIVLTSAADPVPPGLRAGMSLELRGDSHMGDYYSAVGSQLNVAGGTVGVGLETFNATVNLSAGSIGERLDFRKGGVLSVSGGSLGANAVVRNASVQISGGLIGRQFLVRNSQFDLTGGEIDGGITLDGPDSVAHISGGRIGAALSIENGSLVNISGGSIGRDIDVSGSIVNIQGGMLDGRGMEVFDGSTINLLVQHAFFDDAAVTGLSHSTSSLFTSREGVLSGKLADGSDFRFELTATRSSSSFNNLTYLADGATLTLQLASVPEPSSLICLAAASSLVFWARRRYWNARNSS